MSRAQRSAPVASTSMRCVCKRLLPAARPERDAVFAAVEVNRQGLYQPEGHIINLRILERPGVVLPVHVGAQGP